MALNTTISIPLLAPKVSNILDLPDEILKEICSQCFQSDWIRLSLVCRRFRDLAAAQLYRNFHIIFPDEDDPYFDSPIDGLAGGLETFVASDYNYAKHLRELSLDTLSIGDRAELAYKPYLASVSCGKFMNTLLLLTLRKAQSLDTFRWNIRVELSRPVYKALHNIKSLRHLHLRLQAGSSIHQIPPPFSDSNVQHSGYDTLISQWANSNNPLLNPIVAYGPPPVPSSLSLGYKPSWRNKPPKKPSTAKEPPTIEGFRNLESLSVLDIDSLDVITEVQVCVRNSSSTLRKVKLSFSDSLAMQARKPCADAELDESEDDEFQVMPISLSANYDDNGPAKAFQAQEERKLQELVLGRIFEVEPSHTKNTRLSTEDKKENVKRGDSEEQSVSDSGQHFIDHVSRVFERMVAHVNGTSGFTSIEQQDALDAIAKAAKKYVTSEESKSKPGPSSGDLPTNDGLHSLPKDHELGLDIDKPDESQSLNFGLKLHPSIPKDSYDANPEDIDIEVPEEQLTAEFQRIIEITSTDTVPPKELFNSTEVSTIPSNATEPNDVVQFFNAGDMGDVETESKSCTNKFSKETHIAICAVDDDRHDKSHQHLESTGCDVEDVPCDDAVQTSLTTNGTETHLSNVNKYARDTRGIGLHSLSIHLIPIKASVLGKAIDLHSLKRITLLNVGEQKKFWVMMMKENSLRPLPLRKVFTDDVCLQFLHLISQLDCVKEVFMLQRSSKYKPESFAPNPGTTIEQIRNFVLKKHMHSLKRLMIKNQADSSWDVDEKTIQHICRRGKVLEELAVIMGMRAIHTLIQRIAGLTNLRALQLISFRTEDTCLSVMRETRRFIVDALSFHPELKLEWLALGDDERAVRILRKPGVPRKSKVSSNKDKKHAPSLNQGYVGNGLFPVAPVEWGATSESDDDDDDDPLLRVKLELVEPFSFYDIFGIRIFEKEIVNGRL
ncbi:putative f-box domain-containing protein [Daldinia childiae]|uniref:putative f-box domain-containing protein n=1 Tax=Daldinia childiae TaxID=326645 RepID=UPI001445E835|nr:putative f-box domain-containing protein [Daldinia childiae]KAF3062201.1 putative f-box domain-containing protein [Daldinia childiae]